MTLRDHLGPRTPENAALHDELDRLLAARAVALEEAASHSDDAEKVYREAGNGQAALAVSLQAAGIRSLATTDSTEALDRVIRAHVEKALEMAAAECIDTAEEADLMADKHGRQISERTLQAIKRITADDVLREMGGRG